MLHPSVREIAILQLGHCLASFSASLTLNNSFINSFSFLSCSFVLVPSGCIRSFHLKKKKITSEMIAGWHILGLRLQAKWVARVRACQVSHKVRSLFSYCCPYKITFMLQSQLWLKVELRLGLGVPCLECHIIIMFTLVYSNISISYFLFVLIYFFYLPFAKITQQLSFFAYWKKFCLTISKSSIARNLSESGCSLCNFHCRYISPKHYPGRSHSLYYST